MSDATQIEAATRGQIVEGVPVGPSALATMLPIGRRVFIRVAQGVGPAGGQLQGVIGTLVAFDERWFCLRGEDGHTRLIAASQVLMLSTDLEDRPKPTTWVYGTKSEIRNGTATRLGGPPLGRR